MSIILSLIFLFQDAPKLEFATGATAISGCVFVDSATRDFKGCFGNVIWVS